MRLQITKFGLLKFSGIFFICLLAIMQVGTSRRVSAQHPEAVRDIRQLSHTQQAKLVASDGSAGDSFGNAVAISGDTAVVGASRQTSQNNRGAAYVYLRSGGTWSQQQKLVPSDVVDGDVFGTSVAIDGNILVAGAPIKALNGTAGKGAAYVFFSGCTGCPFTQQQQLIASDGGLNEFFGTSVAVSGDTILVGAPNHTVGPNSRQGAVYVFVRNGATWTQQQELTASDGLVSDQLGGAVALAGDTAVAGAREDNFGANRNGKAYVFVRNGTTWTQQQKLTASDGSTLDAFGNSVAINHHSDTIAVGAVNDDEVTPNDRGSVYVFVRNGTTWSQQQRLIGSLGMASGFTGHFGTSVAVDGDTLIAGSPQIDPLDGNGRGVVYLFARSGTTWTEQNRFELLPAVLREFGCSVAMSGDSFIGGAQADTVGTNLGQGSAYVFSTGQTLSIGDASIAEGNSGTTQATFTVTLSAADTHPVNVDYATRDITATAGSDYVATSGTLTFNPGETSKTFNVTINGDTHFEFDEGFFVLLSHPVNATLSQNYFAVGTITNDDPPPTVQFSAANYSVQEDCTVVTITVTLTGDTSAQAFVRLTTSDGTASSRSDYNAADAFIGFAPGETSKSYPVQINEDSFVEGNETFNVTLSNQIGAVLGTPSVATVTIIDDATEPSTNVIDDPRDFAGQHYHDFLSRQADQSGWDFWTNEITSCGNNAQCVEVKRINVSAAFYLSIEFQQTGYLVERLYKSAFGDATGTSTLNGTHQLPVPIIRFNEFLEDTKTIGDGVVVNATGWEQLLENNKQAFTVSFVQRSRFTTAFPTTMTPTQFVDKLNANAGNVLSASERATAIALFGSATDTSNTTARAQAIRQVAEDADLNSAEFNRAFILFEYFGYLRRNPNDQPDADYTGYDFWLTKLNQFNGNFINAESVKAFILSTEYRGRFGP